MEYNFREKIEGLLHSQRRTKKSLYEALGMSMQGFDSMMKNNSFSAVRLGAIASYFGVTIAELYGSESESQKNERLVEEADHYLHEHLRSLESNFARLAAQLESKDQQIASLQDSQKSLQRMLETVLGKSKGATFTPLTEEEKFNATIDLYKQAGHDYASSLLLDKPRPFALFSSAKLVALSLHV